MGHCNLVSILYECVGYVAVQERYITWKGWSLALDQRRHLNLRVEKEVIAGCTDMH